MTLLYLVVLIDVHLRFPEATVGVVVAVVVVVDDVIFLALNIVVVNVVAMPLHVFTHADNIQLW